MKVLNICSHLLRNSFFVISIKLLLALSFTSLLNISQKDLSITDNEVKYLQMRKAAIKFDFSQKYQVKINKHL